MCLSVPSRVVETNGEIALVEAFGQRRQVSLLMLDEAVDEGDYLLVQAGGFAYQKVAPAQAEEALALLETLGLAPSLPQ
ncbi:HypC/HybG/HupF family hydrogenase formation chaperone [Halomonas faecis]|uniref:HypC/HybG/HupF family hydrogenase formation chaperone n=1 Tax=Halomonas faecis TaxID=1562110 RepID=UPI0013D6AD9F|nr:HypC/HybG/HupF family hydrogenase formation chaperone [Halomonas faecis]